MLNRLAVLCVLLAVLLGSALLLGALLVMYRDPPAALAPSRSTLVAVPVSARGVASATVAGEIVERPLFWSVREPLPESPEYVAEESPPPQPRELKGVRLLGLFESDGYAGVIIGLSGQRRRLMIGDRLDGWRLEGVEADVAVFTHPKGGEVRVELEYAGL